MPNQVWYYDADTAITDTKTLITTLGGEYNEIEIWNDTDKDVIVTFGENNAMLFKTGTRITKPFVCSGKVSLSVASGSSTGNFFIQFSRG